MNEPSHSPKQVAAMLGVTVETVRAWIHAGEFEGAWMRGVVMRVPESAITRFRERHRIASVPRGTGNGTISQERTE